MRTLLADQRRVQRSHTDVRDGEDRQGVQIRKQC